jgi:transcriptional regulator with XRE-family HTH domain
MAEFCRAVKRLAFFVPGVSEIRPVPSKSAMLERVHIGQRIQLLRLALGRDAGEVAKRAGYGRSSLSAIERGHVRDPRRSTLLALAGALGVRPEAFESDVEFLRELGRILQIDLRTALEEEVAEIPPGKGPNDPVTWADLQRMGALFYGADVEALEKGRPFVPGKLAGKTEEPGGKAAGAPGKPGGTAGDE